MRKILYLQYTNPAGYPPLEHSSRILANAGWKVLFLGTGAAGEANRLKFPPLRDVTVRQLPFCPPGLWQKIHYLCYLLWVIGWTLFWRPQWIYASDLLASPVSLVLSFLPGVQVVYHEHDTPDESWKSFFSRLYLWARKGAARRARICVLPNQERANQFSNEVVKGAEVFPIWNCPQIEEVRTPRTPRATGELLVYYHGSVGPSYLPITILTAMASLPQGVKLLVVGYETVGCVGYIQQLKQEAARLDLSGRVEFLGALPRYEILRHCSRCDVGIALMPKKTMNKNEKTMVGASNKPFDYLACGLALLVSDLPDWEEMYVKPGYGLACDPDDPGSIASALLWFFEHPVEMRAMGEKGRQRILKDWNYEKQFQPLMERLSASAG